MKAAIRQRALELGFDDCRFTNANPPESANHFLDWIDSEKHGSMAWIKRNAEKRVDPKLVLENASSIITLAASYEGKDTIDDDSPNLGLIARYARYRDYHDSIGEALIQLTEYLQTLTSNEAKSLWYVDTGPILERDIAQRAGLGFIGKHTNLISRRLGNFFLYPKL